MAYKRFKKEKLILRDYLAIDRTILANEVTFLSYTRTALTLFVAGVSFMKFFDSPAVVMMGALFIPIGFLALFVGTRRFNDISKHLKDLKALPPREPGKLE